MGSRLVHGLFYFSHFPAWRARSRVDMRMRIARVAVYYSRTAIVMFTQETECFL